MKSFGMLDNRYRGHSILTLDAAVRVVAALRNIIVSVRIPYTPFNAFESVAASLFLIAECDAWVRSFHVGKLP